MPYSSFQTARDNWRENEFRSGHDLEGDRERQREDAAFHRDTFCDCSHDQVEHRVKRPTTERMECLHSDCGCLRFEQRNLFDGQPLPCAAVTVVEAVGGDLLHEWEVA